MERRSFLSVSAIGAIGAGHVLKAAITTGLGRSIRQLENFRNLIGARPCHFLAVDKVLEEFGTAAAQSRLALGYQPLGASAFWMAGTDTALLPLQLRHSSKGILDTQVLVFSRSSIGAWQSIGSLSGFHLEAIARALPELQASHFDSDAIRKLVLPVTGNGKPVANGWAHPTGSGDFRLSVQITANKTTVEAVLTHSGKTVWQSVFPSGHSLRCATGLLG